MYCRKERFLPLLVADLEKGRTGISGRHGRTDLQELVQHPDRIFVIWHKEYVDQWPSNRVHAFQRADPSTIGTFDIDARVISFVVPGCNSLDVLSRQWVKVEDDSIY